MTGNLGDVMKESAQTALSFLRANAELFQIPEDFYQDKDIHIHVPEGAIPKDGPSAGITTAAALLNQRLSDPVHSSTSGMSAGYRRIRLPKACVQKLSQLPQLSTYAFNHRSNVSKSAARYCLRQRKAQSKAIARSGPRPNSSKASHRPNSWALSRCLTSHEWRRMRCSGRAPTPSPAQATSSPLRSA